MYELNYATPAYYRAGEDEEYDPHLEEAIRSIQQWGQPKKVELSCPCCGAKQPSLSQIHDEWIAECCNALVKAVEENDPDDHLKLLNITYSRLSAELQWRKACKFLHKEKHERIS